MTRALPSAGSPRALSLALVLGLGALTPGCAAEEGEGVGTLLLNLEADEAVCADHCAEVVSVRLHLGDQGPASGYLAPNLPCGPAHAIGGLRAGQTFSAYVEVLGDAEDPQSVLFSGWSTAQTVDAQAPKSARVELVRRFELEVASVVPEPLVTSAAGTTTLTVRGEGLRFDRGVGGVSLGEVALALEGEREGEVDVAVPAGLGAGELVVTSCAVDSEPFFVRVLGPEPGTADVDVGECEGRALRAVAPGAGGSGVLAALSCSAGEGELVELSVGADACGEASPRAVPLSPVALAADTSGAFALVAGLDAAGEGRLEAVALTSAPPPVGLALPGDPLAQGLVANGLGAWVLVEEPGGATTTHHAIFDPGGPGQLQPVSGFNQGARVVALAAGGGEVAAVALPVAGGPGSLFLLDDAAKGSARVTPLSTCTEPTALAIGADGRWAAIACAAPTGIEAHPLDPEAGPIGFIALAEAPLTLSIDGRGDVAFAWAPATGTVTVASLPEAQSLIAWSVPASAATVALTTSLPGPERLVLSGASASRLTIVQPYDPDEPCQAAAP